jgi:flagellar hook assembly protein FlgD
VVRTLFRGKKTSGNYDFTWDGKSTEGTQCPAGIYLVRLSNGYYAKTQKVVLLK